MEYRRCDVAVDEAVLPRLRAMGADGRLSADHMLVRDGVAVMILNRREIGMLGRMGFKVKVGSDVLAQARRVRAEMAERKPALEGEGLQTGFVNQYLDTAGILGRFASLHAEFPALTTWEDLPHPTSGYDGAQPALAGPATVKLFRINTTPGVASKPGLLLVAGTHAREWIPPIATIEFAEQLLRTYSPGSTNLQVQAVNAIVAGLEIFIVPAMNPDGINLSHHDFAMWRKNRRQNPAPPMNCPAGTFDHRGVDNNRNYSTYWGDAGSSGEVCSDSYRGPAAVSEPENRNIAHLIEQFPNLLTAVDCHSFGEDIFRAQPTGGAFIAAQPVEPRDHQIFLGLEGAMNAAISSVSPGKTYSTGTTNNHAGTCDDYLFLAHRIFGFTIECAQDFQPPIATGLVAVQEVTAALRALATQTLSLASQFTFPVNLIHVLDRSGSMVGAGYVEPAKSNARRMIDLMSLNDSVGLVSFNQSATTHMALTAIANSGVFATARNAVDAIVFGGATSIGAGLQAAGTALAGASGPKAIVLLSDGYENRAPLVAAALPTLPAGTKVSTIALGPQSDQALLETIASATGGQYHFSPDEIELHEIYNFIRAEATGEELALNESFSPGGTEAAEAAGKREVIVDEGAASAVFSVSWNDPKSDLRVTLRPPQGPVMDLSRVRTTGGAGYKLLRVRRPQAGIWSLEIERMSGAGAFTCTMGAFLRSDLRLRLAPGAKAFVVNKPLSVLVQIHDGRELVSSFQGSALVARPAASLSTLLRDWKKKLPPVPPALLKARDALPQPVLQALVIRDRLRKQTGEDPLRYLTSRSALDLRGARGLVESGLDEALLRDAGLIAAGFGPDGAEDAAAGTAIATHAASAVPGTYNFKLRAEGRSQISGRSFVRVGLRSLLVR